VEAIDTLVLGRSKSRAFNDGSLQSHATSG